MTQLKKSVERINVRSMCQIGLLRTSKQRNRHFLSSTSVQQPSFFSFSRNNFLYRLFEIKRYEYMTSQKKHQKLGFMHPIDWSPSLLIGQPLPDLTIRPIRRNGMKIYLKRKYAPQLHIIQSKFRERYARPNILNQYFNTVHLDLHSIR